MKLIRFFVFYAIIFSFSSCNFNQSSNNDSTASKSKEESISWGIVGKEIVDMETKRLPITIQKLDGVTNIQIDSFVVVSEIKPYSGYLVTHWKMKKPDYNKFDATREINPKVIVEVNDIVFEKDKTTWETDWHTAYMHVRFNDEEY